MPTNVLCVENLQTAFRVGGQWRSVVHGISFDIAERETVAVVGESGSGKSVTALSIMGLTTAGLSRSEGSVKLRGREILNLPQREMREIRGNDIAMIFQEPMTSLNPVLTVGDQICESLIVHRGMTTAAAKAEAVKLLDRVRIPGAATRLADYPHNFSGGMRQRVMIAMALACKPKLLIADEPTTALDVTIQAQILNLIKELQEEEGMGVLFITHDMGVVAQVADRTVVMYGGKAVEAGATADIFHNPIEPYTRSLLAAVPKLGSLQGSPYPARFPIVDRKTGAITNAPELALTVMNEASPTLQVRNLTTRYDVGGGLFRGLRGRVHAVENISFNLHKGETLALVGESGCGKSTTGRSVMRLTKPHAGEILLYGEDLLKFSDKELRTRRKGIQMVFQDPYASLNPRMTVGEAIAEPMIVNKTANRAQAHNRAKELLEQVGLKAEMTERYPHEFSGGQRQRVCIARALALEPSVIVADEAVSALDVSVKAQVVNLMLDLQERLKLSYLFISHDMAVVERVSHRVAVMYLGEIVEIGPRQGIFENPQHPYTKRLLSAVPIADPSQRSVRRQVENNEVASAFRKLDFHPPVRRYREISPGHQVMQWEEDWTAVAA